LWLDRCGRPFNPTKIVGPAALAALLSGMAPAASRLSLHACSGIRAASVWADPEPRPQDPRLSHPLKDREGGPLAGLGRPGQTSRQPDAKSSAMLAGTLTPQGPGPAGKGSRTPLGKPRTASGRRRFDHVSAMSSSARHLPNRASPSKASQVGFGELAGTRSPQSNPRCPARTFRTGLAATRMRLNQESHLDVRLGRQPRHWATPVFMWTSRRPGPVGATLAFGHPSNPTEFSDSDRRGPRARAPVPGRNKHFNSSNLVAIPPTARWVRRTNQTVRHWTTDTDSATQT
jgi:hypothetical protein